MEDSQTRTLTVKPGEDGIRLDVYCAGKIGRLSRSQIQKLNKSGRIKVNSTIRPHHYQVRSGDKIQVVLPPERTDDTSPIPQNIPIRVIYEDDHIVVINKDAGIVMHPAHGNWDGTLVNALLGRGVKLSSLGGKLRPGVVHRLDKDTSGVVVLAKSDAAYEGLAGRIKAREFEKNYHAIIWGNLGLDVMEAEVPIGRHPVDRKKMAIRLQGGKEAFSRMFVIDSFNHFEYIRVDIKTGRTHQIRVHLSHFSHPVLGDPVYGGRRRRAAGESVRARKTAEKLLKLMKRQALHASKLAFNHPVTSERLEFRTALPADMRSALEVLHLEDQDQGG